MRFLLPVLLLLPACTPSTELPEGRWTGAMTPMRHPDMETPVAYRVAQDQGTLAVTLEGPNGTEVPLRDVTVDADTLRFVFNEPEEGVQLTCALAGTPVDGFAGRCTDADGQWARFTMRPPGA